MNISTFYSKILFMFFLISLLNLSSCGKRLFPAGDYESAIYVLGQWEHNDALSPKSRKLAQFARRKLENKTIDREPILVDARLADFQGHPVKLVLLVYDETYDINDFEIIEKYYDKDGNVVTTKQAKYSMLFDSNCPFICGYYRMPYEINLEGQNDRMEKIYDKNVEKEVSSISIPIPEPNKVDVYLYVYDKEGNKSNRVELSVASTLQK